MIGKTNASAKGGSASGGTTNPSNGVYIYADDGKYYTTDEWMAKYNAVFVAVITDNCQFGIALEDAKIVRDSYVTQSTFYFGNSSATAITDAATAKTDYNGLENTRKMSNNYRKWSSANLYNLSQPNLFAVDACRNYKFSDGRLGYVGSAGEWQAFYDNRAAISEALDYAGGSRLSGTYWTSTLYQSGKGTTDYKDFGWYFSDGLAYDTYGNTRNARAFCRLDKSEGFQTQTFSAASQYGSAYYEFEPGMTWEQWAASSYAPSGSKLYSNYSYPSGFYILISGYSYVNYPQIIPSGTSKSAQIIGGIVHLEAKSEDDLA